MARPRSLKTRLTVIMVLFSLTLVIITSLLSHAVINKRFVEYITRRQQEKTGDLLTSLSAQYSFGNDRWDLDYLHMLGMYALYDGYIITVNDASGAEVWGAQTHDMTMCYQVMDDIQQRMEKMYPSAEGEFTVATYPLEQSGQVVGDVQISYYGPYFLSENDFDFLNALNAALVAIAVFALIISVGVGRYVAERVSHPILRAVEAAQEIEGGNYATRLEPDADIRELQQLAHSINHLSESLGKQDYLRRQLTADVAHELRTPLTSVGTHLEAMMDGVWEPTAQRLQSCHEEIQRLGGLVRDMEQLSRVENQNQTLDKVEVRCWDLIEKSLDQWALEIGNKRLLVEKKGEDLLIFADPHRFLQVIYNLLSNAIKYTPTGGRISISLWEGDGYTHLVVEDNGTGIAGEDLPYVFERFYRGDKSRNRRTGGSGIGLAIVKSIVTAHGGYVEVASEYGKGSVFQASLPKPASGQ